MSPRDGNAGLAVWQETRLGRCLYIRQVCDGFSPMFTVGQIVWWQVTKPDPRSPESLWARGTIEAVEGEELTVDFGREILGKTTRVVKDSDVTSPRPAGGKIWTPERAFGFVLKGEK